MCRKAGLALRQPAGELAAATRLGSAQGIEESPSPTFRLIGENPFFTASFECSLRSVSTPGEPIAKLGIAKVYELPCNVQRFGKGFHFGIAISQTIFVTPDSRVLAPDSGA